MEVYLIRHTTPAVPPGFIYGRLDVEVTAQFPQEVETIKTKLPARFDIIYSSPARRCLLLAEQLAADVLIDDRLSELNFGDWEGQTWDSLPPAESAAWMQDFVQIATPNGESMAQMNERVQQFWQELVQTNHPTVGIVTHGGVIRLLLAGEQGLPLASAFDLRVDYGAVFVIHPR